MIHHEMAMFFANFQNISPYNCLLFVDSRFVHLITFSNDVCLLVDGKIRRRRQYTYNNFGSYAIDPAVIGYYGTSGGGSYTGNLAHNNRLIVGGVVYQYPTPVNVMSAGAYNPQQYNSYPTAADGSYYRKRLD